jgi:Secretion system C-terminal sorting domain
VCLFHFTMTFSKLISTFSAALLMVAVSTGVLAQPINDICSSAIDLQPSLPVNQESVLLGPYSNEFATGNDLDIATVTGCWLDDLTGLADGSSPQIDATVWFRFEGYDGELMLYVQPCDSNLNFLSEDTQMALYTGECDSLELVACNEDVNSAMQTYWSGIITPIASGTTYYLAVDGFNYGGFGSPDLPLTTGEFCLQFSEPVVSIEEKLFSKIVFYPNPTHDRVHIQAEDYIDELTVWNTQGECVTVMHGVQSAQIDIFLPEACGVYVLSVQSGNRVTYNRVVKY